MTKKELAAKLKKFVEEQSEISPAAMIDFLVSLGMRPPQQSKDGEPQFESQFKDIKIEIKIPKFEWDE